MPHQPPPGAARNTVSFVAGALEPAPLTPEQIQQLEAALSLPNVDTIDVRGRNLLWPKSLAALQKMLIAKSSLRVGLFEGCSLGDEGTERLIRSCLQSRPSGQMSYLTSIDMSMNGITDAGAASLGRALATATSCLQTLLLRCNPITLAGMGHLLSSNLALQVLDLSWCAIGSRQESSQSAEKAVKEALLGIHRNTRTRRLLLRGCAGFIDPATADRLLGEAKLSKRSQLVNSLADLCREVNSVPEASLEMDRRLRILARPTVELRKSDIVNTQSELYQAVVAFASLDGWPLRTPNSVLVPLPKKSTREPLSARGGASESPPRTSTGCSPARRIDPVAMTITDLLKPFRYELLQPRSAASMKKTRTRSAELPTNRSLSASSLKAESDPRRKMLLYQCIVPGLRSQLRSRSSTTEPDRLDPGRSSASRHNSSTRSRTVTTVNTSTGSISSSRASSPRASTGPLMDRPAASRRLANLCAARSDQFAVIFGIRGGAAEVDRQLAQGSDAPLCDLAEPMPPILIAADGRPSQLQHLKPGSVERITGLAKILWCVRRTTRDIHAIPPPLQSVMSQLPPGLNPSEAVRFKSMRHAEVSRANKLLDSLRRSG